jgi:hypothetical protein
MRADISNPPVSLTSAAIGGAGTPDADVAKLKCTGATAPAGDAPVGAPLSDTLATLTGAAAEGSSDRPA